MMLRVVEHIKEHGLEKTLAKFKLKSKDYPHKVLIKYDQIESDMSLREVQESRGLVLEKGTWKIMSMSFEKFFNSGETQAAKIDWSSARILEKLDGSLIHVYWDWVLEKWCAGTTGTAEAEGEVNNKFGTTFADLFWNTAPELLSSQLTRGNTYVFEMCTPYNIVVKPHTTSSITLLAVRNTNNLKEAAYEWLEFIAEGQLGVPVVKAFDMNASNAGHVIKTLEGMPYTEEGYVVVDKDFNRIKIKNPTYVAVHHLKSKTSEHAIMDIVKANEVEEFAATFPERRDEIFALKAAYDQLRVELHDTWEELKNHLPRNITKQEQKKFAMKVFEVAEAKGVKSYTGLFFSLKDGKVDTVDHFMANIDNKRLYQALDVTV